MKKGRTYVCEIRCLEKEWFNGVGKKDGKIEWKWACGEEDHL